MIQSGESIKTKYDLISIVLLSLILSFVHQNPLYGHEISVLLMAFVHLCLLGWLLLRVLRIKHDPSPIMAFAWVMGIGLSFVIVAGGVYRLLGLHVSVYALSVHLLMLALIAILPKATVSINWQEIGQNKVLYLSLALLCALALGIGIARSQIRYSGWEDQTVFIGAADWLSHSPYLELGRRQVGAEGFEVERWIVDGWTYQHAVWTWSTGVPAATIIWHMITPLFAWMTPLLAFAMAYSFSGRKSHALYTAIGFMIVAVLTLDSLVYISNASAYGQNMLAQLNTLRMFSTGIMLPLGLMMGLAFLKAPQKGKAFVLLLLVVATAFLHSRQIVMISVLFGLIALLLLLRERKRQQVYSSMIVGVLLVSALAIPLIQRQFLVERTQLAGTSMGGLPVEVDDSDSRTVDLVGVSTLEVKPEQIFYHPLVTVGFVLGLLLFFTGPRRFENQFIVAVCVGLAVLFWMPGISRIFVMAVTPRVAPGFVLMLPLGMIFGTVADTVMGFVQLKPVGRFQLGVGILLLVLVGVFFEPIPMRASGKDQLAAIHALQSDRRQLAADAALIERFNAEIQLDSLTVILAPNRIDNYVVEQIPYTYVMGGRANENRAFAAQVQRFYMQDVLAVPFLDTDDLALLQQHAAQYVIVHADDSRLPMILMQPHRFKPLFVESGYSVFAVLDLAPDAIATLFAEMNTAFLEQAPPRWLQGDFDLRLSGDPRWMDFAEQWQALLSTDDSPLVRYGLAVSLLLAGEDGEALPHWQALAADYPVAPLLHQAVAHSLRVTGAVEAGRDHILAALDGADSGVRVVLARTLLQESFFYALQADHVTQLATVIAESPAEWALLATYDKPALTRRYAMLLMSAGQNALAIEQLQALSPSRIAPGDMITLALLQAEGDPQRLLEYLAPYTDFDQYAAAYRTQADRWQQNSAAGLYHLLRGNLAQDAGQVQTAIAAYEQAVAAGLEIAGEWFLAQVALQQGDFSAAEVTIFRLAESGLPHAQLWALSVEYQLALAQGDDLIAALVLESVSDYAVVHGLIIPEGQVPVLRALSQTLLPQNAALSVVECCTVDAESVGLRVQWLQRAYVEYPENQWGALVFDAESYQRYGELALTPVWVTGAVVEWPFAIPLDVPVNDASIGIRVYTAHEAVTYAETYVFDN